MINTAQLCAALQGAREDAVLRNIGRFCTNQVLLRTSNASLHLDIEAGLLTRIAEGPFRMRAWQFALRAEDDAWLEFWQPQPRPGYHDIFALSRFGHLAIDGDIGPLLTHLRFFKHLIALPRGKLGSTAAARSA